MLSKQRAFTLIELLIVIAIIAILAGFLFPVFARAKEAAKKAACLSNTKQLSLGIKMYSEDADGVLPPTQNGEEILWPDLVASYIRSANVRVCPSDSGSANSYGLNQLLFIDFTDFANAPRGRTDSELAFPSQTVMLGETGTEDDLKTPRRNTYKLTVPDDVLNDDLDGRPSPRHFSLGNLAFFDGHAKALRLEQFYTGQTPADKWFCADPNNEESCKSD